MGLSVSEAVTIVVLLAAAAAWRILGTLYMPSLFAVIIFITAVYKGKMSSMARGLKVENLLAQNIGLIINYLQECY